ncbi:MAG TPA: hypothetical protein ENI96_11050, partial [Sedimenticola thiotaurini]|nr:hypothetical protein [Sedimenticola thiotaurini]
MMDSHPPTQRSDATGPNHTDDPFGQFSDGDEETIDLAHYWRVVRRHKWGILSITLIAVIIGALYALSATPIYQARTVLLADPIQPNVNTQNQYVNTALVYLFYETQYEIIKSRTVAERAVDKLDLVEKYKQEQQQREVEAAGEQEPENLFQRIRLWRQELANWRQWLPEELRPEPAPEPDDATLRRQLATEIQAGLTVKGGKQSEIINVSYDSP